MKQDILDSIKHKKLDLSDYSDEHELYEAIDYDGSMNSIIDSEMDIYYYDIRKWAVDNWEYVEQAIEEGLCEGVSDYHKLIQSGQWVYYSEQAREAVEEIWSDYEELEEAMEKKLKDENLGVK
tara:strand:- start:5985 stop:6353 length:369 start_codon:yes stop_codon:yes gene_type:complete